MSYQIKKDIEQLSEIQRRIAVVQGEDDEAKKCLERAYSGLSQTIQALEQLQDVLLEAAQTGEQG